MTDPLRHCNHWGVWICLGVFICHVVLGVVLLFPALTGISWISTSSRSRHGEGRLRRFGAKDLRKLAGIGGFFCRGLELDLGGVAAQKAFGKGIRNIR